MQKGVPKITSPFSEDFSLWGEGFEPQITSKIHENCKQCRAGNKQLDRVFQGVLNTLLKTMALTRTYGDHGGGTDRNTEHDEELLEAF